MHLRHSCAAISILFNVNSCNIIHSTVFVTRRKGQAAWTREPGRVSTSASSDRPAFRFRTSSLPYLRNLAWYTFLKSSWPLISTTRCPMMTQDVVQLSGATSVWSGRDIPTCFTGSKVTPRPGITFPTPLKSSGMISFCIEYVSYFDKYVTCYFLIISSSTSFNVSVSDF